MPSDVCKDSPSADGPPYCNHSSEFIHHKYDKHELKQLRLSGPAAHFGCFTRFQKISMNVPRSQFTVYLLNKPTNYNNLCRFLTQTMAHLNKMTNYPV